MVFDENKNINMIFDWLRFPLICFVVFIHCFGKPVDLSSIDYFHLDSFALYNLFRIMICHVITHIAVPLFFFMSGFLFFYKLKKWDFDIYKKKMVRRIKTICVPFVIWNSLYIFYFILKNTCFGDLENVNFITFNEFLHLYWDCNVWNQNRINLFGGVSLSTGPFYIPLWFLRDLIVLFSISPLIYFLLRFTRMYGIFLLFLGYVSQIEVDGFSFCGIFFFSLGGMFITNNIDPIKFVLRLKKCTVFISFFVIFIMTFFDGHNTYVGNIIYPFGVCVLCVSMLLCSTLCVKHGIIFPKILVQSTFFIYLLHGFIIGKISKLSSSLMAHLGEHYVIYNYINFIFVPVMSIFVCFMIYCVLRTFFPKFLFFFTGER